MAMGRPSKMTDEKIRTFEKLCRMKPTLVDCAEILGVDASTIDRWVRKNHKCTFTEFRNKKMAWTRHMVIRNLLKLCEGGNLTALIYVSKNLCKWSDNPSDNIDDGEVKVIVNGKRNKS